MFHYKTTIARSLTKLLYGVFFETFDKTKIFMSAKLKTDLRVILTKNPSRELIWSQTIMMKMMKILHFHVKTVVLNLLKKNMSYHICVPLGMLENLNIKQSLIFVDFLTEEARLKILKWESHIQLDSITKLLKQVQ